MNPLASAILISWNRNAAYGQRLLGDVEPGMLIAQPVQGRAINHPAWIFSHLNLYAGIAAKMARGEPFDDPADHPHGAKSEPLADPSVYDSRDALLATWARSHEDGAQALRTASDQVISAAPPVERWRTLHPTVGDMLVTLMVKHESGHLGQMSAWRRAIGLPRVAV
ncbi:MAG: DinB family protein [Phycisphaerales bacterium]|nr:DinB family protein [Phycisphaerales bacterium]